MTLTTEKQLEMLRSMQTIRRFEERASDDYQAGAIYGVVHCYIGEEAVAVGVCSALNRDDQIISTHRGHGHCLAKGADLNRMMAELYGRQTGYCKGKRRLHAHRRFQHRYVGSQRHCRWRHSHCNRCRSGCPTRRQGTCRRILLWGRCLKCGSLPRVNQHRRNVEAADALRLREQSLLRRDPSQPKP